MAGRGTRSRLAWGSLAAAALLAAAGPADARKENLADRFPELRQREHRLGRTVILTDVVVVDDVGGKVEKVKLGRSRDLARFASAALRDSLARRGYVADSVFVASIGTILDLSASYQSDSIAASGPDDVAHVIHAPFFLDSLVATPEDYAYWNLFVRAGWVYGRKQGAPPGHLAYATHLGERLDCETVGFFVAASWGIPTTKKVLQAVGGLVQKSRTTAHFVLADARTGEVLWKVYATQEKSGDEGVLAGLVGAVTEDLP